MIRLLKILSQHIVYTVVPAYYYSGSREIARHLRALFEVHILLEFLKQLIVRFEYSNQSLLNTNQISGFT